MIRLIRLEWSKFSKNTVIQLLLLFFFLFFPACMYFGSLIPELPAFLPNKKSFFQFPSIWEYLGYAGNWMVFFFLGVAMIYFVTIEVSTKTLRQSIINGMTRNELFASKLISLILIALTATLYYALLSLIIGILHSDEFTFSQALDNDWAISRFFLMSFAYLNFALFLAYLFRKSGIAVFFYISYIIVIEPLIRIFIVENSDNAAYSRYFPMNAAEDLVPFPVLRYANAIPSNIDFSFLLEYNEAALLTIAYSAIFLGLSYWMFLKNDI